MCANCGNNNMLGINQNTCNNNPNGNIGLFVENGNNAVMGAFTTNNDAISNVLNNNSNLYEYNNNSCNCNNTCNCSGNNCNCNNNNPCNCNGDNTGNLGRNVTSNNLQENLRNFIGRRCTCEFNLCGTCFKRTGVLSCVGSNFITLASTNNNNCLLCDTAGLTFVTVHNC